MRLPQTIVLLLLTALMLVVTITGVIAAASDGMTWSLTVLAFVACAVPLFAVGTFTILREPRNGLVTVVSGASLLALPFLVSLDVLAVVSLPMLVLDAGLLALLVASILGNRRQKRRFSALLLVVLSLTALLGLGVTGCMGAANVYGANAVHAGPSSPDGVWTLVGYESNMGAMDSGSAGLDVQRDVWDLLREDRQLWYGNSWGPKARWLNSSTVLLDGKPLNIFRSPSVDVSE